MIVLCFFIETIKAVLVTDQPVYIFVFCSGGISNKQSF